MRYWLILLCFLTKIAIAADSKELIKIGLLQSSENTQIIFTTTKIPLFKIFKLTSPNRIVIDFTNTRLKTSLKNINVQKTPILTIRNSTKSSDLRIVFELKNPVQVNQKVENKCIFLTLKSSALPTKEVAKNEVAPIDESPGITQRDVVIAIDPGHGGKDPGASGFAGTHEKDVVLGISKKLQSLIENQAGMRVVMTRRGDYYVGLRQRLQLARKDRADMFIAIHADAYRNPYSSGASVYALSASGASSEAARWLAEKENYSELGNISLEDKNDVLRSVLLDLSQTATISLSLNLGSSLLQELSRIARLHHNSVEQARFVVLKSPDIPSVLVETGFISNTKEERRLRDPLYQYQLARALMEGIRRYFIQNPPPGTVFAVRRETNKHIVKAGETLDIVARKFAMSVKELREANQLTSNYLKPGQVLLIPG